jgi:hypothetical protein
MTHNVKLISTQLLSRNKILAILPHFLVIAAYSWETVIRNRELQLEDEAWFKRPYQLQ